jgi:hypothetical protein
MVLAASRNDRHFWWPFSGDRTKSSDLIQTRFAFLPMLTTTNEFVWLDFYGIMFDTSGEILYSWYRQSPCM